MIYIRILDEDSRVRDARGGREKRLLCRCGARGEHHAECGQHADEAAEQYLGKQLFDRSGLHVRPTQTARELVELMRSPLHHLEALRRSGSTVVEGHLRVGIIESMQAQLLPGMLRIMGSRHPASI